MRIIIDEEQYKKLDIPADELLYVISAYLETPVTAATSRHAVKDGFIVINQFDTDSNLPTKITITSEGLKLLEGIMSDTEDVPEEIPIMDDDRFDELAIKLQELFPKGRKEGTNCMWRDSKTIIAKRLRALIKKYNVNFTDEQAVAATKRYIESFNGDYRFMQVLKYFISKKNLITGEENSQLLSYIENEGVDEFNNDWTTDLV